MYGAEKRVEKFLKDLGIGYEYERPVYLKDTESRPRVWTPDFYLPELGVYVEVWGKDREVDPYRKHYVYRKQVFQKNNTPVIYLDEYKSEDEGLRWQKAFMAQLNQINLKRYVIFKSIQEKFNEKRDSSGNDKRD